MADAGESLPKSTVVKCVREALPPDLRVASDTIDLLVECSSEFVKLVVSEANEASERQKKSTVTPEHVVEALTSLGFADFLDEVRAHWQQCQQAAQEKPKFSKKTKAETTGLSEEEQIAMQDRMFAEARARKASFKERLQSYGLAGIVAYGLLNTLYYTVAFHLIWRYGRRMPKGMGLQATARAITEVAGLTWAGSQVTKVGRAAAAVALAPVVDALLDSLQGQLRLRSKQAAFLMVLAACLATAAAFYGYVLLAWA